VAAIMEELQAIEDHNKSVAEMRSELSRKSVQAEEVKKQAARLEVEIDGFNREAERRLQELRDHIAMRRSELAAELSATSDRLVKISCECDTLSGQLQEPRETAPARQKIADSELLNRKLAENKAKAESEAALEKLREKSQSLSNKLKAITESKEKQLAAVKWPVAGLGWDDDGVTLNGLPFEQASAMAKRKVAVAIGCQSAPTLRFMFIQDGSLLDDDALKDFAAICAEHKVQLFVERVGAGSEVNIVIEHGEVARADDGFVPKKEESKDEANTGKSGTASQT
jgi:hypothetical protein